MFIVCDCLIGFATSTFKKRISNFDVLSACKLLFAFKLVDKFLNQVQRFFYDVD